MRKLTQGDISGFLSGNKIAVTASIKPLKYAPPSPKKIFPKGKLNIKKPKFDKIKTADKEIIKLSLTAYPINKNAIIIITEEPEASPLNPSIIFIEFVNPLMQKVVNITDIT